MRSPRSIRARLITLCVVTLSLIFICFGGYIYWGFKQYLCDSLREALVRRAHQIATTILADIPERGDAYVGSEIQVRYAPELNERVIRVTAAAGRTIYASRNANTLEAPLPVDFSSASIETPPAYGWEKAVEGGRLLVAAVGYSPPGGARYTVEVGAPENDISSALGGLLFTLVLGFPVFIGLTAVGAYHLLGRALRPVDEIVRSAERITLRNLSQRLPAPGTGDEVERLTLALNRMIQRLDESYQVTSRFAADASHELRTPLTIMRGELEALLKFDGIGEDDAQQIGSVLEEVDRLTAIVEGLLAISRLEAGETQLGKTPVDLSRLAATTVEQLLPLAEEKAIALECRTAPGVMVEANEVRLKQVVVNLVDNAIKYTPESGRITVQVAAENSEAILEVTDNGIGISAEALPHIFQRFYRSEQAEARRARGTGLGLSMVQSILEAHGGKISVESREGNGACFRILLPLSDVQLPVSLGPHPKK